MLYEAAVGNLPWAVPPRGSSQEELLRIFYASKMQAQVDFSRLTSSQATLIRALLSPDPKQRPSAQQALKMLGAQADEIHGGTVLDTGARKRIEIAPKPKPKPRARTKVAQEPKALSRQADKITPPRPLTTAKPVDKVKRTSLLLLILTIGLFHPISTWSWYTEYKTRKYLTLAIVGSALSSLYLVGFTFLPKEIDPQTGSSTVEEQYSGPLGLIGVAFLVNAIYAHIHRPRQ
jgi:serine/threonine protein kinase